MSKRGRKSLGVNRTVKRFVSMSQLTDNKNWRVIVADQVWGPYQHALFTGTQIKLWLEASKALATNANLYEPAAEWETLLGKLKTIGSGLVDVGPYQGPKDSKPALAVPVAPAPLAPLSVEGDGNAAV